MSGVVTVKGSATGCTLIDRSILDRYSIKMSGYDDPAGVPYNDTQIDLLLSDFCNKNGIAQKAHVGVHCGHRRADGKILWPKDFLN
jgi:hypothetical protein